MLKKNVLKNWIKSNDIKRTVGIILLIFVWLGVAPELYKLIINGLFGSRLKGAYDLFDNNILLNVPTCICLIYVCIKWCKRILLDKEFHFYRFPLIVFAYLLLYYQSPFDYANIIWIIDFRLFLSMLLVVVSFFLFVVKEVINKKKRRKYRSWHSAYDIFGFSPDIDENINHPESLKAYAKSIVDRLLETDLSKESFAVGITSEWGAGKTTFLRLLRDMVKDRADIVVFNPWMCRTPEQVTSDFFSSLRHQLSKKYSSLSRPIKQYAKYLNSISFSASKTVSIKLPNIVSESSLFERKKELSEKFTKISNPIVVMIDDVDRLDGNEVFEVLRLIRNTADLGNVIYLVAYDKKYVTSILNEKNIKDASVYLEKIFQIEIQLPLVTNKQIWKTLVKELEIQLPYEKLQLNFISEDEQLVLTILNTYRRAKRFTRLFSLSYYYLSRRESIRELDWLDVFWLDLLQMSDKKIYDVLCYEPNKLLRKNNGLWVFNNKTKCEISIIPTTRDILFRLFGRKNSCQIGNCSICRIEYFDIYFTLQVQFSVMDIDRIIDEENVDALIETWHVNDKRIANNNMADKLVDYDMGNLNDRQKINLLWGMLSYCYYYSHHSFLSFYGLKSSLFEKIESKKLSESIVKWFNVKLTDNCDILCLSRIMGEICHFELLKDNEVESVIQKIIDKYLDKNNNGSALDFVNYNSSMNQFLRSFDVHDGRNNTVQIAFEYLFDIFAKKESKPSADEYEKAYEKYIRNGKHNIIKDLYNDKWEEKMNLLKESCFCSLQDLCK